MSGIRDLVAVIGVLAVCPIGCGSDGASETSGTRASLGCIDGTLDAWVTHVDLEHEGTERSYELFVPSTYDGREPLPVILNFHGFTSSGVGQQSSSGMDPVAEREGFIVAYPNGLDYSWNGGVCCGRSAETGVDDVGFTRTVIEDLGTRGCIDNSRIYATGMSNGGFFSHRLACEAADVIAAVAPVAGVLGIEPSDCSPSRPISLVHLHGTADPLVPYDGGGLAGSPSVDESTAGWRARNGCEGEPEISYDNGAATCETVECDAGTSVTLCSAEGAGHCWLGQPCPDGFDTLLGEPTFDIDSNEVMWDLFSRTSLP